MSCKVFFFFFETIEERQKMVSVFQISWTERDAECMAWPGMSQCRLRMVPGAEQEEDSLRKSKYLRSAVRIGE